MSIGEKVFAWLKNTMASVRYGEAICARCVRVGDGASPGIFGDYGVCPRCEESVTSETKAFFVEHLPVSTCDPVKILYRCAVCRETMSPLSSHRCERAFIRKILETPAGWAG